MISSSLNLDSPSLFLSPLFFFLSLPLSLSLPPSLPPSLSLPLSKSQQGRRDGSTPDEPFAWASREFLRKLAIGRQCTFRVDSTSESTGRAFGAVFVGGEDASLRVAAAGFARVKPPAASSAPSAPHDELAAASAAAEAAGRGLFARPAAAGAAVAAADAAAASPSGPPHFGPGSEAAAEALLAAAGGRGSTLRGVVEYVSSGSSLRATLLAPTKSGLSRGGALPARGVPLILAGAVCPSAAAPRAAPAGAGAAPAAPAAAAPADPYAPVARHFSESRLLHRDALVTLLGVDKHGNLVASVSVPPLPPPTAAAGGAPAPGSAASVVAAAAASGEDIALSLVGAGLARAAEWGLSMLPSPQAVAALRGAERAAKARRAGVWRHWAPPAGAAARSTGHFRGTVAEVVSGDVLVVRDDDGGPGGAERRLCLASTRAPRLGRRDAATGRVEGGEPLAAEAKEFLRSRLIGRTVDVRLEYERKVPTAGGAGAGGGGASGERLLSFAAVSLPASRDAHGGGGGGGDGGGGGGGKGADVAELLLARGLATVARHRADDERASGYEGLLGAEAAARAKKRGVHGLSPSEGGGAAAAAAAAANAPQKRANDVSGPGSSARARAYLPSLTRSRQARAVVEHVLSGHRLKLSFPKEGVVVAFNLADVRVAAAPPGPSAPGPAGAGASAAAAADPVAAEAAALVRRVALQRDVEVEVEACDRGGTFLGTLRIPPPADGASPSSPSVDLATLLVEAGLAKVTPMAAADGGPRVEALQAAQREAQRERRGSWKDWDPAAEAEAAAAAAAAGAAAAGDGDLTSTSSSDFERISVVVTDVRSFDDLSVQLAGEPRVDWIASTLRGAALDGAAPLGGPAARGSLVAAKFSADGQWYRARVDAAAAAGGAAGGARVTFVDFGNSEAVPAGALRRLPAELAAPPPQALAAKLSFVKSPPSASAGAGSDGADGDELALAASDAVASALGGGAPLQALVVSRTATAGGGVPGRALSLVIVAAAGGHGGEEADGSSDGEGDEEEEKSGKQGKELSARDAASGSLNAELLRAGLLRLDRPRFARNVSSSSVPQHLAEALSALEEAQDAARRGRRGIWEYGDPGGDSDEDERRGGGGGGGWGASRKN